MDDTEITMWGIHSEDDRMFLDKNVIAIGWEEMGDLSKVGAGSRDDFKALYRRTYPDKKPGATPAVAGMLRRFVYEMTVGDYVVFPSKADRMVNIGRITGGYEYHPDNGYIYSNIRTVEWLAKIPRIEFSQGALSEISSLLTLFRIKQYGKEFIARLHGEAPTYDDEETIAASAEAIQENTKDFILKTLSRELKGYDLEPFVANLLNAMGYLADKETKKVYHQQFSRKLPQSIQRIALRKLMMLDAAERLDDLRIPPSNHLEQLHGDREGQRSIRINAQYRVCFIFDSDSGNCSNVTIVDYH